MVEGLCREYEGGMGNENVYITRVTYNAARDVRGGG